MRVIREIKRIKDKKIVVDLPEGFQAKEIEVIILPIVYKSKNQLISPPDIFIAATAISHNLSLVTLNKLQKAAARNRFRDA